MYVLYYNYDDCENHNFEIIAVSESKQILEEEINRITVPIRDYLEKLENYNRIKENYCSANKKKLREWLTENIECVREIRPQMFNGEFYVKDFHTLNNTPYSPNVKKREQEKSIDVIVSIHWELFLNTATEQQIKQQDEFINKEFLTVPVIVLEDQEDNLEPVKVKCEFNYCGEDSFKIKEVKVL